MRVYLLITCFYFIPLIVVSQDTIFVKTGEKIICRVINADSLHVYYDVMRKGVSTRAAISQHEVQQIKYCTSIKSVSIKKRNALLLSIGVSLAIGEFASDDLHSELAGLAGNGLNLNLIYTHSFTQSIFLAFKGFYGRNRLKADVISKALTSSIGYPVSNNSVNYTSAGLLVGPSFLSFIDKLTASGHALLGYGNLNQPRTVFSVYTTAGNTWVAMTEISAGALVYNLGIGLVYSFTPNWDIVANGDYLNGSFKFGQYKIIGPTGTTQTFNRGKQYYEVVNISVGLRMKL